MSGSQQTTERVATRQEMVSLLPLFRERIKDDMMGDLKPWTCMDCPFDAKTREPYNDIWNDPSEAHYLCPVAGKEVWGEQPVCGDFNRKALLAWLDLVAEASA